MPLPNDAPSLSGSAGRAVLVALLLGPWPAGARELGPLIRLTPETARCFRPTVAALPSGGAIALWHGFVGSDPARLFAAEAGAARPSQPRLPPVPAGLEPALARDPAGRIHLVYRAGPGSTGIYWSALDGSGWSPPRLLSAGAAPARYPTIAVDGDTVTAVWEELAADRVRLGYSRSEDRGKSWTRPRATGIPRQRSTFHGHLALITDGAGRSHLLWEDGADSLTDIYHSEYRDGTWSAPSNLSASPEELSGEPSIIRHGDGLEAVWVEQDRWNGRRFGLARAARVDGVWRRLPAPAVEGSGIYRPLLVGGAGSRPALLWEADGPDGRMLMLAGADDPVVVSAGTIDARRLQVAATAGGGMHLVFDALGSGGSRAVYYRKLHE